jgi:hypothetical protein
MNNLHISWATDLLAHPPSFNRCAPFVASVAEVLPENCEAIAALRALTPRYDASSAGSSSARTSGIDFICSLWSHLSHELQRVAPTPVDDRLATSAQTESVTDAASAHTGAAAALSIPIMQEPEAESLESMMNEQLVSDRRG